MASEARIEARYLLPSQRIRYVVFLSTLLSMNPIVNQTPLISGISGNRTTDRKSNHVCQRAAIIFFLASRISSNLAQNLVVEIINRHASIDNDRLGINSAGPRT